MCEVHFPKTELTDRTFGILDPTLHSDIASEIAGGWASLLDVIFNPAKRVYSYSFPIPVSKTTPGAIGGLRAGRMIYEWIEMAEEDVSALRHERDQPTTGRLLKGDRLFLFLESRAF